MTYGPVDDPPERRDDPADVALVERYAVAITRHAALVTAAAIRKAILSETPYEPPLATVERALDSLCEEGKLERVTGALLDGTQLDGYRRPPKEFYR